VKNILKTEETFTSICPECNTEMELPISQKDKEHECIECRENFIAKEALEKKCPHCGEMIKSKATICKFCKEKVSMPHKRRKLFGVGFSHNMIQRKKREIIIIGVSIIFFIREYVIALF
jgi:transposase